eukprot:TRINITY_DN7683_c0_g1_i1.p1 TRINITY_DN7683_c0_g1~~TRINITY_DN7683_c0_g1_i1.p1  ORF type:complete len:563 (+),score=219.28 TRINITY_DN7683_c0_g1_i1:127-1815(+)
MVFFNSYILTKKGPLNKIWLAAHWEKKLSKQDIQSIDLGEATVNIMQPSVPISARTGGELLLGCTRVYANKVAFLLRESQEVSLLPAKHSGKVKVSDVAADAAEQEHAKMEDLAVMQVDMEEFHIDTKHDFEEENIDKLLGQPGGTKHGAAANIIDDEWFQAGVSQAVIGLKEQETQVSLTQDALRDLAGADGQDGQRDKSVSEHAAKEGVTPRREADELDVGRPVTEEDEAELRRLLESGGPAPPEQEEDPAQRPSLADVGQAPPLDVAPIPPPDVESEFAQVLPAAPPRKKAKLACAFDKECTLSKEQLKKNQESVKDITQVVGKNWRRFPGAEHAEYIRQDANAPVHKLLRVDPLAARMGALCGRNVPNLIKPVREDDRTDMDSFLRGCINAQFDYVTDAGAVTPAPRDQGAELDAQPLPPPEDMWQQPEMPGPDEFAPLPEAAATPALAGMKRRYDATSAMDPTESAQRTLDALRGTMRSAKAKATFQALTSGATRRVAAQKFVDLLVLGSKDHVVLSQDKPYGEITVGRGRLFEAVVEADATQAENLTQGVSFSLTQ